MPNKRRPGACSASGPSSKFVSADDRAEHSLKTFDDHDPNLIAAKACAWWQFPNVPAGCMAATWVPA